MEAQVFLLLPYDIGRKRNKKIDFRKIKFFFGVLKFL